MKKYLIWIIFLLLAGAAIVTFLRFRNPLDRDFAFGNGRMEATEIMIAAKTGGRIDSIFGNEGDMVRKGQILLRMDTRPLEALLAVAKAQLIQAEAKRRAALVQLEIRKSDVPATEAALRQREFVAKNKQLRDQRAARLLKTRAVSEQDRQDAEMNYEASKAEVERYRCMLLQAQEAVRAAQTDIFGAEAAIKSAQAEIARIEVDLQDCEVISPRTGRIQYRMAQEGEVISSGGRVLNLVDLSDVYMTFFLPENAAGRVRLGDEARILLDALPDMAIPAKVSYIASSAQFTPKTVETQSEREKLMFRIKAKVDPAWIGTHMPLVKPGIPGVAYVRLNPAAAWPAFLQLKTEAAK